MLAAEFQEGLALLQMLKGSVPPLASSYSPYSPIQD
jgi:hypothetical protein